MQPWRTWRIREWNNELLLYFFHQTPEDSSDVVNLLITPEELARAVGAPEADCVEVRDAFVTAVKHTLTPERTLLREAINYPRWPASPDWQRPPPFLAHLIFTCIAASESDDSLTTENAYISRLRQLAGNCLSEASLQDLPVLWRNLSAWLKDNPETYRQLILPDPGGYTRIGITIKLAFPDRRDQAALSTMLDQDNLTGQEPPVARVLALVGASRAVFRAAFITAFNEFRDDFQRGQKTLVQLGRHPFWAAVREGALRGRGQAKATGDSVNFMLLAEVIDERLSIFAVADGPAESASYSTQDLPWSLGAWRFLVVPAGPGQPTPDAEASFVNDILAGRIVLGNRMRWIRQGILPFTVARHGLLELATRNQIADAPLALVKNDQVEDLKRIYGQPRATRHADYPGWTEVHEPALRQRPSSDFDGTALAQNWGLQQGLPPARITLSGGVALGDAWLGSAEILPELLAPGASEVALEIDGEPRVPLVAAGDGRWRLPMKDYAGQGKFLAGSGEFFLRQAVRFLPAPVQEAYHVPTAPDAWIVERFIGTGTLAEDPHLAETPDPIDHSTHCEQVIYLGCGVGEFVPSAGQAWWIIVRMGRNSHRFRGPAWTAGAFPEYRIDDAHARNRWRKNMKKARLAFPDPSLPAGMAATNRPPQRDLPMRPLEHPVQEFPIFRFPNPVSSVDRLVGILAGIASNRAGISGLEWTSIGSKTLGLDDRQFREVTRAWLEAGLVDFVSSARWSGTTYFPRRPELVAFRSGGWWGATLSGLTLPRTRRLLMETAHRLHGQAEERHCVSPHVPVTLTFRMPDVASLQDLARQHGLALRWLRTDGDGLAGGIIHAMNTQPPGLYNPAQPWTRWSLTGADHDRVRFDHHFRIGCASYWTVASGEAAAWSYSLNAARILGAALLNEPIVDLAGSSSLRVRHAYLPLPLARVASALGSGLSGPTGADGYQYPLGSTDLCAFLLETLNQRFQLFTPEGARTTNEGAMHV
jgi:hypothetical protein